MAVFSETYPIHTYEADLYGKATFAALFRFLQDIAARHANSTGYGLDDLKRNSFMWVLSRFLFRGRRVPRWQERLHIDTWPTGTDRLFALRDWLVSDEEGREVAIATSGWVVIDIDKRTPVRVEKVAERMDVIVDRRLFDRSPGRVPPFETAEPVIELQASFSDMDLNGHVNATRYIEWMFEALPEGFLASGWEPEEVEVNFIGESRSGDEMEVYTVPADPEGAASATLQGTPRPPAGPAESDPATPQPSADHGEPAPAIPQSSAGRREGEAPLARRPAFLHSVMKRSDGSVLCRARSLWRPPAPQEPAGPAR